MATAPVPLFGKVSLAGKGGLLATRHAGHIGIQNLQLGFVIVTIGSTVLLINHSPGFFHLEDIVSGARIQGIADDQLLRTTLPPKCATILGQNWVLTLPAWPKNLRSSASYLA